ncbi:MAG: choice-of-anchor L domain-containing protein [Pseudomonadota bacterium]
MTKLACRLSAVALAALTRASIAHAGATVTSLADASSASAASLVEALLSPSSGLSVVAGSAQYTGAATASGTFTNGNTDPATGLGIDSGVVLTTGDARFIGSSAAFAGDAANSSGTFTAGVGNALTPNTTAGSSLFGSLTSAATFNASVLSFEFIPLYSSLTLSFVFASEDYNDVVNSGFPTDVFGIFINGVNQALVPGTNLAISASTINCGGPTSGPANGVGAQHCDLYRDNPAFYDDIDSELNGFTVVLDLALSVNAGQVNRMSIGIADAVDTFGDSAVLLRTGSVAAVPEPSTWALMLGGFAACGVMARRRRA